MEPPCSMRRQHLLQEQRSSQQQQRRSPYVAIRDPAAGASRVNAASSCAVAPPANAIGTGSSPSDRCGTCSRRLLICVGFIYFQLSTYTLLQWVSEHAEAMPSLRQAGQWSTSRPGPTVPQDAESATWASPAALSALKPSLSAGKSDDDHRAAASPGTAAALQNGRPQNSPINVSHAAATSAAATGVPLAEPAAAKDARSEGTTVDDEGDEPEDPAAVSVHNFSSEEGLQFPEAISPTQTDPGEHSGKKVSEWIESDAYGKFIGISTFFNPGRHQNKVDNFREFHTSVASQGLQMLCVELVFGTAGFQLSADDCDIFIPRRTSEGNTLWQKERLLNIALENLPNTVEKVMWLDSDLIFLNDNWVPETAELLDRYPVVQPFGWMTYLPAGEGAEYANTHLATLPLGQGVGAVYHAAGLGVSSFNENDMCFRSNFVMGHPGFAWAARRDIISATGFYDRSIIGGGDRIMLNAFTGHFGGISKKMPPAMAMAVRAWAHPLSAIVGASNISYTPGVVLHIWHGDRANRDYTHRYQILLSNSYNPAEDVRVNGAGVLEWNSEKPRLHQQVTEYFNNRKEGPRPNSSHEGLKAVEEEEWTAAKRTASRAVRSYTGYHCHRPDYRPACKIAFKMWGEALRVTQLQQHQKALRKYQAEQAAQLHAARERERSKRTKKKSRPKISGGW